MVRVWYVTLKSHEQALNKDLTYNSVNLQKKMQISPLTDTSYIQKSFQLMYAHNFQPIWKKDFNDDFTIIFSGNVFVPYLNHWDFWIKTLYSFLRDDNQLIVYLMLEPLIWSPLKL